MKPGARKEDGSYELTFEEVPRKVSMEERIHQNLPLTLEQTGNRGYTLRDVYEGKVSMEAFIAQLSDQDLAVIVRGEHEQSAGSSRNGLSWRRERQLARLRNSGGLYGGWTVRDSDGQRATSNAGGHWHLALRLHGTPS